MLKKKWSEWLCSGWCIVSVIGVWPCFIEPQWLKIKSVDLDPLSFPSELHGIKLLHFSDLHWNSIFPLGLEKKMTRRINALKPDLILFSGDFLCRSKLENPSRLKAFLESLKANIGCFAVLGNHDYAEYVTVNEKGDYDVKGETILRISSKGSENFFTPPR